MKEVLEFLKSVVDRSGVKSLVAGGGIYTIYLLAIEDKVTIPILIGIVLIVVLYFGFRHFETINTTKEYNNFVNFKEKRLVE